MHLLRPAFACIALTLISVPAVAQESRRVVTLDEAHDALMEQNFDLRIRQEAIEQSTLLEDQARSTLLPTVTLTAIYTLNDSQQEFAFGNPYTPLAPYLDSVYNADPALQADPNVPPPDVLTADAGGGSVIRYRHDYLFSGRVRQPLFNRRALPLLRQARIMQAMADNDLERMQFEVEGHLYDLYFQCLALQRYVQIAERNVAVAQLNLSRAEAAVEEDVGLQFEANRARVAVSSAERDLESAYLAYELAVGAVAVLVDIEPQFDVVEPEALEPPANLYQHIMDTVEDRPELQAMDLAIELDEEEYETARADFWPTVEAVFNANSARPTDFGADRFTWNLQVIANWEVYAGGYRDSVVNSREYDLVQSELRREQYEILFRSQMLDSYIAIQRQTNIVESARAELELAQENYALTTDARDLGVGTWYDVEAAQNQLYLAELALADAEVGLQAELYEAWRLTGGW